MGDQQQWHQERGSEIRSTLQPRIESNSGAIALVEGIEQIRGTKEVECSDQDDAQSSGQRCTREQRQDCGCNVAVRSWTRELQW